MQHIAGVGNGGWAVSLLCGSGGPRDSTTGCCGTHENGRVGFFTKGSQIDPDTACSQQPASNVSVNEYEWNHIAVTVENDTIVSFYINGALSGEFTSPSERIRILDAEVPATSPSARTLAATRCPASTDPADVRSTPARWTR